MENKKLTYLYRVLYIAMFIVASIPVSCAYVMEGGDILIWLSRIEEVKDGLLAGQFLLFPSAELTVARGAQMSALYSNLWLLFPALIRMMGGSITLAYRIYMLLLNAVALLAAKKMFEAVFEDRNTVFMGVLLYMTSAYRIYICYDKASLGQMAAWSLIPLAIWGTIRMIPDKADAQKESGCHTEGGWKYRILMMIVSAIAYAAIGYADGMLLLITMGVAVLGIIWYRKPWGLIPIMVGGVLWLPGMIYFARYILKGGMEVWGFPLGSIASKGYVLGQFFTSWVYREDCPGLGMGLLAALFVLFGLGFVEGNLQIMKKYGYFVIIMVLLAFMSMNGFLWDFVQRVGSPFLRLVPLMETPGICFGFATLAACVLGAYGAECAGKQSKAFVKIGFPLIIVIAAVGVAVYTCNTLTYSRLPMYLIDSLP